MPRYLLSLTLILLTLTGCTPAAQQQVTNAPPRPDQLTFPPLTFHVPRPEIVTLDNGIRLYLMEDHELPLVEVTTMVEGGAISDPADKTGLTDLFAEVLRSGGAGSLSPDEFDDRLESMAAELSVQGDTYSVNSHLSIPSESLADGLDLLSMMLRQPRLAEDKVELARRRALEGVRRQNDEPRSIAQRLLMASIYPDNPLGRVPTMASIENIKRTDLLQLQHKNFAPNKLWMAVSGSFQRDELIALLNHELGNWAPSHAQPQPLPALHPEANAEVLVADKDLKQTTIMMGHLGIDKDNPDMYALRVMNYILGGGGFNSRMMREIRSNRGLAYSVYSYFQLGRWLPGAFLAGCETKNSSVMEAVNLMLASMDEMRQQPVSHKELQLAKESLINSFVFAFNTSHDVVNMAMRLDFFDYPPGYLENYRDRLAAVTVADVQRVAQEYLLRDKLKIVLVGNPAQFDAPVQELGLPVKEVAAGP